MGKWENIIVIGIVPSLAQEPKNLNQFLEAAVDELKALWKGICLRCCLRRFVLTFRAAIIGVSSDIPATLKICGFKGHSTLIGCLAVQRGFLVALRKRKFNLDSRGTLGNPY